MEIKRLRLLTIINEYVTKNKASEKELLSVKKIMSAYGKTFQKELTSKKQSKNDILIRVDVFTAKINDYIVELEGIMSRNNSLVYQKAMSDIKIQIDYLLHFLIFLEGRLKKTGGANLSVIKNQKDKPFAEKVIVINAGGTINMEGISDSGIVVGRKPSGAVDDFLAKDLKQKLLDIGIPFEKYHKIFDREPDSSNIGPEEWNAIIGAVRDVIDLKARSRKEMLKNGIDKVVHGGIVVTHGTDTLQLTSFAVALEHYGKMNDLPFPIIFTASYATMDSIETDARDNILKAIYIAKEKRGEDYLPGGVYVVIGDEIHLASRVCKVYTTPNSEGKYFYSYPDPVGKVQGINKLSKSNNRLKVTINKKFIDSLMENRFDVTLEIKNKYGKVEHIMLDAHSDSSPINRLKERMGEYYRENGTSDYTGVIIQGDFSRSKDFGSIANELLTIDNDHNIITFVSSKNVYYKLISHKNSDKQFRFLGLIHKSLTPRNARMKLSFLLKHKLTKIMIIHLMNKNLVGEIVDMDNFPDWIDYETYDSTNKNEIINIYPGISSVVYENTVAECKHKAKNLIIYGFGDGHIPTTNISFTKAIRDYLLKKFSITLDFEIDGDVNKKMIVALNDIVTRNKTVIKKYFDSNYNLNCLLLCDLAIKVLNSDFDSKWKMSFYKKILTNNSIDGKILSGEAKNDFDRIQNILNSYLKVNRNLLHQSKGYRYFRLLIDKARKNNYDKNEVLEHLLKYCPTLISAKILKEAIMETDRNLKILGEYTNDGHSLYVRTQAVRSYSNIFLYENGQKLYCIGAKITKETDNIFGKTPFSKR